MKSVVRLVIVTLDATFVYCTVVTVWNGATDEFVVGPVRVTLVFAAGTSYAVFPNFSADPVGDWVTSHVMRSALRLPG